MNTFDRILWRINGILIFIGVLSILLLVGYVFTQSSLFSSRQKEEAAVITTDEKQEKQYLELRRGSVLTGTDILRSPLSEIQSGGSFSSSGYGGFTRNFLFVNPPDLKSWWLLPDHKGIIQESHDLSNPRSGDSRRVVASIYEIITKDTNGDGRISSDDHSRAYFSTNAAGSGLELTKDSIRVIAVEQVTDSEAIVLFQPPTETRATTFLITNGNTVSEAVIPLKQ